MNNPTIGDDRIDWDKEALRASEGSWPYTLNPSFKYLDKFVPERAIILDLGCNIASWSGVWKDLRPNCEYHGLDFSPVAIEIAKKRYPDCVFHNMNVTEMSFENKFNVIFTHAVLQHMNNRTHAILVPKIHNALVDDGVLVIQENIHGDYSEKFWLNLFLPNGFKLVKSIDTKDGGMNFVFQKILWKQSIEIPEPSTPIDNDHALALIDSGKIQHNWELYYKLKPGDIFVEVGSFWGRYVQIASPKVRPGGRIIAIEPNPTNVEIISALIEKRELDNVTLIIKALTNYRGLAKFNVYGNPAGTHLAGTDAPAARPSDPQYEKREIEVLADTLTGLLKEIGIGHIDLLATDCEGCEENMLMGASFLFDRKMIKNLALSVYHTEDIRQYAIEFLCSKGYRIVNPMGEIMYAHI